jgi:hypothetical protein
MSAQNPWQNKIIGWGIVLGLFLGIGLIFMLQLAWVYWYGWAWYLLVWGTYFNFHFLLARLHWEKKHQSLEFAQIIFLLVFGIIFYLRWFHLKQRKIYPSQNALNNFQFALNNLQFVAFLACLGISWLNWANAPLLVGLNLLILCLNALVRVDSYLYYRLVNLDYFSFNLWFRQPSPLLKREVVWVIEDMLQKSHKTYKYKEKIYDFLVEYLKQYSHPFYHPKGAQKVDL